MTEFEKAIDLETYVKENDYEIYGKKGERYFIKQKTKKWKTWWKHTVLCKDEYEEKNFINNKKTW